MAGDDVGIIYCIPIELLWYIFTFLPPKDFMKCRVVCSKWQRIIDAQVKNEKLWRKYCRRDYLDICDFAQLKSQPSLCWYHLYRSLTLWPKLYEAREIRNEFAVAKCPGDEIHNFQVLRGGMIGIHKRHAIVYYDLNTLKESHRDKIIGSFCEYRENDNIILLHDHEQQLLVTWKATENTDTTIATTFNNVKLFLLLENVVYYVTAENEICLCKLVNGSITNVMVKYVPDGVQLLGFKNGFLNILTSCRTICTLVGDELKYKQHLKGITIKTVKYDLKIYNFLDQIEWKLMFPCTIPNTICITPGCPLLYYTITTLFSYGSVILTGTNLSSFRIYYLPEDDDLLKVHKPKSLRYDCLLEEHDCSKPNPIIRIDIVEGYDSHTVLLALLNKVVVIKFIHDKSS